MKPKNLTIAFTILWLVLFSSSTAVGTWSGAATGAKTATGTHENCTWTSKLAPEPAVQWADCAWMHNALAKQGFDDDGKDNIKGNSDDWTINFAANLSATINITEYFAYVGSDCDGGTQLRLSYAFGQNDPSGLAVHWIQVISTNAPKSTAIPYAYSEGAYYEYIDVNYDNLSGSPFYPGSCGPTFFYDRPERSCKTFPALCPNCCGTINWDAQVFLATGNLDNRTLTLYEDGVWWGFELTCVPEPATICLLGLGGLALVRRRRGR